MRTAVFAVCLFMIAGITPFGVHAETYSCTESAEGGGFGNNKVECSNSYSCRLGATMEVTVSSTDEDAVVSGGASCADGTAQCTGSVITPNKCSEKASSVTTSAGDDGTCKGVADEAWKSAMSISCAAVGGTKPTTDESACDFLPHPLRKLCDSSVSPEGWIIERTEHVDIHVPERLSDQLPEDGVAFVVETLEEFSDEDVAAHVIGVAETVVGFICSKDQCIQVPTACQIVEDRLNVRQQECFI